MEFLGFFVNSVTEIELSFLKKIKDIFLTYPKTSEANGRKQRNVDFPKGHYVE